jgi:hypothetical protein
MYQPVAEFSYLGSTSTSQNIIHEEIKMWNSGNACYHLIQNLMSSCVLPHNANIKIYDYTSLHVVLYGCKTWSFTLKEEYRMVTFEIRGLRIPGSNLKNSDYGTQLWLKFWTLSSISS